MSFRFYKILFLLFFIGSFQFSNAQEIWDWRKCIEYAMQNNLQLKQTELNVKLEEVNLQKNKLPFTEIFPISREENKFFAKHQRQ